MKSTLLRSFYIVLFFSLSISVSSQPGDYLSDNKKAIIESVEKHQTALIDISDQIWALAETAFEETQSAQLYRQLRFGKTNYRYFGRV